MNFLPRYQKWLWPEPGLGDDELNALFQQLLSKRMPIAILLASNDPNPQQKMIILESYLAQNHINPRFPYPIYIVSQQSVYSKTVPVIEDESQLPRYFNLSQKELSSKERELLYKINFLVEKTGNSSIAKKFQLFAKNRTNIKKLFMISREAQYYEDLLVLIRNNK